MTTAILNTFSSVSAPSVPAVEHSELSTISYQLKETYLVQHNNAQFAHNSCSLRVSDSDGWTTPSLISLISSQWNCNRHCAYYRVGCSEGYSTVLNALCNIKMAVPSLLGLVLRCCKLSRTSVIVVFHMHLLWYFVHMFVNCGYRCIIN